MAYGLFATLVTGLILKQLALLFSLPILNEIGMVAGLFLGSAIGVGVAYELKAPPLVLYSSIVTEAFGAGAVVIDSGVRKKTRLY
ncbi:PTS sugar transporter subunit IIC [endosymbiont 'TC1' of Trimyema compressum]|uniref:PTS sugar transporter subunit IIC n=1 Tax=endosymbiont 'TC1' of Trimyema compressum TaxID=243899 RepID=UPI001FE1F0BC